MISYKKRRRVLEFFSDTDLDEDTGKCIIEIIGNERNEFKEEFCDRFWTRIY